VQAVARSEGGEPVALTDVVLTDARAILVRRD